MSNVATQPYIGTWTDDSNGPRAMAAVFGPLGYSHFTTDWIMPVLVCRVWAIAHRFGWLKVRPR